MSIYATWFSVDEDEEGLGAPFLYYGSHVMPAEGDARGGYLYLSAIPGHIGNDEKPALADEDNCHPWLRVSVGDEGSGDATIILNRVQAGRIRDVLTEWLDRSGDVR